MHRSQPVLDLRWHHCQPFHHLNPSSAASSYIVFFFSPVDSPRKINKSRVKSVLPLARSHCAVLKILLDPLGVFWLAQLEKKNKKAARTINCDNDSNRCFSREGSTNSWSSTDGSRNLFTFVRFVQVASLIFPKLRPVQRKMIFFSLNFLTEADFVLVECGERSSGDDVSRLVGRFVARLEDKSVKKSGGSIFKKVISNDC